MIKRALAALVAAAALGALAAPAAQAAGGEGPVGKPQPGCIWIWSNGDPHCKKWE